MRAAAGVRGDQPYRLQVARAGRDDSAPGRNVANYARVRVVVGGVATATFAAPTVGRWRARATYLGTRGRAPSLTGFAPFSVDRPLRE